MLFAESTSKIIATHGERVPMLVKNMLYNLTVDIEIPGIPKFSLKAILDKGTTTYCVDQKSVPK